MQMRDAIRIIENGCLGYMVEFEEIFNGKNFRGRFPDKDAGEPLIETEEKAWEMAEKFAAKTFGKYVNVHVVDENFVPVKDYTVRMIENR